MKAEKWVFLNGKITPSSEAKVSIFDRGFIFGDGIYEVMPIIRGKMVDKKAFYERLIHSCSEISLTLPYEKNQLFEILQELIIKNNLQEGGVYLQITRGVADRNFRFLEGLEPTFMAFVFQNDYTSNPLAQTGITAISVEDIRWKRRDIKSISLLAQCYANTLAFKAGAKEAFMLEDNHITEGSHSSVFVIKNHTLITRALSHKILPGIRRAHILKLAKKVGLQTQERTLSLQEVYEADEVFISAATLPILGVIKLDDRVIADGKVGSYTKKLRNLYIEEMLAEAKE